MLGKLTSSEIESLLLTKTVGRIGCCSNGRVYVVPISYAYDGQRIIGHSAEGMKLEVMRANPEVCFEVEDVENMGNWRSVIAWGTFQELRDAEALSAMGLLVERFKAVPSSETSGPLRAAVKAPERAVVYAIRLKEKTGRFEKR